jgi:hypothetical protein
VSNSRHRNLVILTGYRLKETDKAVQFQVETVDGEPLQEAKTEWFPLSQVESSQTTHTPDEMDTLTVSEWIVEQKGLVE